MVKKKCKLFTIDGHPIEIYRKGRGHRVFVDTVTGRIVATNPLPIAFLEQYGQPLVEAGLGGVLSVPTQFKKSKAALDNLFGRPQRRPSSPPSGDSPPSPTHKDHITAFEKAMMIDTLEARRL